MLRAHRKVRPGRKPSTALIGALAAGAVLLAGCGSSSSSSSSSSNGQVTLKVRLFGTFGYKEAGLFGAYQQQHPNVKIDYQTVEDEGKYYTALQTSLASGSGLGDVQGIEIGRIADVTHNLAAKFVDLNTLGPPR